MGEEETIARLHLEHPVTGPVVVDSVPAELLPQRGGKMIDRELIGLGLHQPEGHPVGTSFFISQKATPSAPRSISYGMLCGHTFARGLAAR